MLCMTTEYNQKTTACKQASVFLHNTNTALNIYNTQHIHHTRTHLEPNNF